MARCVVALLDAVGYLCEVPDDDPALRALDEAGCFRDGVFDPGPEGAAIIRDWQLADEPTAGPADLLAALAVAAQRTPVLLAAVVPAQAGAPLPPVTAAT